MKPQTEFSHFEALDIRIGRIVDVALLSNAKYTTHKLTIDFGPEVGTRVSGARLVRYELEELRDKRVLGIINLHLKQIGKLRSDVLTLGVPDAHGECVLIAPDGEVPIGGALY